MRGLVVERGDRSATLTLDRPPNHILDLDTLAELDNALGELVGDRDLQLLLLRSTGDKAFSTGVSIEDHTPDKIETMLGRFHAALRKLVSCSAVTVAVVRGHCLGGGLELATACDFVIATHGSRFGVPEIELGCFPPAAAALFPALIGHAKTVELLVGGGTIGSREAASLGLIARAVEDAELDEEVERFSGSVLAKSGPVTRLTKQALAGSKKKGFLEALEETEKLYSRDLAQIADMQEGLNAFLEKRKPVWKHR